MTKPVDIATFADLFAKMNNTSRVAKFVSAIETFNAALAAREIYNVVYQDLKTYTIGRFYEAARDVALDDLPRYDDVPYQHREFVRAMDYCFSILHTPGRVKKIDKYLTKHQYEPLKVMRDFYALFVPVAELIEALKPFVKKGRQPNPNAVPAYVPPRSTQVVIDQINAILTAQIASVIEEFRQLRVEQLTTEVKAVRKMAGTDKRTYEMSLATVRRFATVETKWVKETREEYDFRLRNRMPQPVTVVSVELHSNWKELVEAKAKEDADYVRAHFVMKNAKKLAKIVELKGNFKDAVNLNAKIRSGAVHADTKISFADGAEFMVRNKIVWKTSSTGTDFTQYPTTFHDVKFAGGEKMALPHSEERMNKVFPLGKE